MKRELFTASALTSMALVYSFPATAQPYDWTGVYVGGVAGYGGLGPNTPRIQPLGSGYGLNFPARIPTFARNLPFSAFSTGSFSALQASSLGAGAFTAGATLGYNKQYGHIVLGIETDFSSLYNRASSNFSRTDVFAGGSRTTNFGVSVGTDWLYTLRGRLGYAQDRWLVFGTGGLALGQTHFASNFGLNERALNTAFAPFAGGGGGPGKGTFTTTRYGAQASGFGSHDDTRLGYVVGGGVEYAVSNHLTFKLEGLYYDLGSDSLLVIGGGRSNTSTTVTNNFGLPNPAPTSASSRITAQPYIIRYRFDGALVRVGANYKF